SNRYNIEQVLQRTDLLIGAVLIAGARAPVLVTEAMIKSMKPGAVVVDVAVDQGGCVETIRPTTVVDPVYTVHGVLHYGVTNMPALVPRTSTFGLTNATLPYALQLAVLGPLGAVRASPERVHDHRHEDLVLCGDGAVLQDVLALAQVGFHELGIALLQLLDPRGQGRLGHGGLLEMGSGLTILHFLADLLGDYRGQTA